MTINEVQERIIEDFSLFDDWMDKYNHLIDLGKTLPATGETFRKQDYLIEGCQSKVWLKPDLIDGKIVYTADSDAIITKGIIALLISVLSERKPSEIIESDLYFIDRIGLRQNLSPTRSNGLLAMVKQMKLYAIAYDAKFKSS